MKTFEECEAYAQYERESREGARLKARNVRHLQKAIREMSRQERCVNICFIAIMLLLSAALMSVTLRFAAAAESTDTTVPEEMTEEVEAAAGVPETQENELIEAALLAQAHRIDDCTVTHYDCCVDCCGKADGITASGVKATPGVTVAVDPSVIPLGSDVLIDWGDGSALQYCRADDVGGAVKGNHIDLCVSSHTEALTMGVQTATVYWVAQN